MLPATPGPGFTGRGRCSVLIFEPSERFVSTVREINVEHKDA
jgi:hypothetical protein